MARLAASAGVMARVPGVAVRQRRKEAAEHAVGLDVVGLERDRGLGLGPRLVELALAGKERREFGDRLGRRGVQPLRALEGRDGLVHVAFALEMAAEQKLVVASGWRDSAGCAQAQTGPSVITEDTAQIRRRTVVRLFHD